MGSYGGSSGLILMGLMGIFFSDDTGTAMAPPATGAQPLVPPVVAPSVVPPVAPVASAAQQVGQTLRMAGGGEMSLPPLSSFLKYKKSANIHESTTFLSLLGIIFLGGILLSTLRAKDAA